MFLVEQVRQTFSNKRTQTVTDNAKYTLWSTMKTKSNDLFLNDSIQNLRVRSTMGVKSCTCATTSQGGNAG